MGINVKATERNVSFEKNKEKWAYVMMPETYSTLAASKVIDEASIRSTSVPSVNEVSTKLISSCRVIFTPCSDICKELASTPINITCYDRNGKLVKLVNSSNSDISGGFAVVLKVNDEKMGSVSGAGNYDDGTEVTITATPAPGYRFDKWDDGNTSASRILTVTGDITLTANFVADSTDEEPVV